MSTNSSETDPAETFKSQGDRSVKIAAAGEKRIHKQEKALSCIFMGTLREIREELQNIRLSVSTIKAAGTDVRAAERDTKIETAWDENKGIIEHNHKQVSALFRKFPDEIYLKEPGGAALYDWYCDDVTHLANQWERFMKLWGKYGHSPTILDGHFDDLDKILCDMIFGINTITIPERINEHFESLYPGQELDFTENFGNELCKKEDATPILKFIGAHPQCVDGIVDTAKGKIYKVDPHWWRRALSFVFAGLILLGGFILALLLPGFLSFAKYPLSITVPGMTIANTTVTTIDFSSADPATLSVTGHFLCACFFLVIIGGLAHLLISGLKQKKNAEPGSVLALEGWLRWFHIKEQQNCAAGVFLIIGFAGMLFILKTADYATAFLIGYSIDSFVDLFMTRFDVTISAKTDELKKKVPQTDNTGSAT